MKRIHKIALFLAGALAVLMCFPAPRHAFAEAVASAIGTSGSATPQLTVQVGGSDGTNLRTLSTDTGGHLLVNPAFTSGGVYGVGYQAMPVAGTDGTNVRTLATDSAGVVKVSDLGGVSNPAIYDVTSAVGGALDSGILDVSAWRSLIIFASTPAGGAAALAVVDDTGASIAPNVYSVGASYQNFSAWGLGTTGANAIPYPLPRRIRATSVAVAGLTTRIRIEGRR